MVAESCLKPYWELLKQFPRRNEHLGNDCVFPLITSNNLRPGNLGAEMSLRKDPAAIDVVLGKDIVRLEFGDIGPDASIILELDFPKVGLGQGPGFSPESTNAMAGIILNGL